jgi:diguanylate cyclase (GGDEF)-like protein/PAS domain S-box-containing protein
MDVLGGFKMPACIINASGLVILANAAFAELGAGASAVANLRRHVRQRGGMPPVDFERCAAEQIPVELTVGGVDYSAHLHTYEVQGTASYLVTFLKLPSAPTISASLQAQMLRHSVDCIKLVRRDGTLEYMNRAGCLALGVSEWEETFGMAWLGLLPKDVRSVGEAHLQTALQGVATSFPGRSVNADGSITYWDNLLTPVDDPETGERKVICVSRDVTQEVQARSRLKALSETDELTGLFNRRHFNAALAALCAAGDQMRPHALFVVDLDDFKAINDGFGHHAGDEVLRCVAGRWLQTLPTTAVIARLGGDEFAILCELADDLDTGVDHARAICAAADAAVPFDGHLLQFGISAGYAILPGAASTPGKAFERADLALRAAKAAGKGGIHRDEGPALQLHSDEAA